MKLLVIGDKVVSQALTLVLAEKLRIPVIGCEFSDGLGVFLTESPSHIMILFCGELPEADETLRDIKNTREPVKILHSGLSTNPSPDYFQMPYDLGKLVAWLEEKLQ